MLGQKLFLKEGKEVRAYDLFDFVHPESDILLLPYLFKGNLGDIVNSIECTDVQLEALCMWVQPNLKSDLPIAEIKNIYKQLINYIDNTVMENSPHKVEWRRSRELID